MNTIRHVLFRKTLYPIVQSLFLLALSGSCSPREKKTLTVDYPVKICKVIQKSVPYYVDTIGHVSPFITIDVRSRVEGELLDVFFKEGDEVNSGDPMFTIDPRPFEATLEKVEGQLRENQAHLRIALEKMDRYQTLLKDEYISQLDFDQLKTDVALYQAMIDQNHAQITEAKLNIEYAHITSPIRGKTSLLKKQKGNLITANDKQSLVSIKQLSPIYVLFTLPQKELAQFHQYIKQSSLKIRVTPQNLDKDYIEGSLDMIDNAIDEQIGSLEMRAIFANDDLVLWPGEFVKVRLIYKMMPDALLVPNEAVIMTSKGPIAYVVNEQNEVDIRSLEVGQRQGSDLVITKGLNPNETVVTYGQLKLFKGATVQVINSPEGDSL